MKHPACFLSLTLLACMTGSLPANAAPANAASASSASHHPARSIPTGAQSMSLAPFLQMARESPCHQIRNRLFLIDNTLIFWDRLGNCPDNAREQTLFGSSVETVLATSHDSIAGPINKVHDEQYRTLFETIMANREAADLGLGARHQVKLLPL